MSDLYLNQYQTKQAGLSGLRISLSDRSQILRKSSEGFYDERIFFEYEWLSRNCDTKICPKPLHYLAPESGGNYYEREFIKGASLDTLISQVPFPSINHILENVIHLCQTKIHFQKPNYDFTWDCDRYFNEKLLHPWSKYAKLPNDKIRFNYVELQEFTLVFAKIVQSKLCKDLLYGAKPSLVHGDLSLSNIIVSESQEIYLIDPNKEPHFPCPDQDWAKLKQNLAGGFLLLEQMTHECDGDFTNVVFTPPPQNYLASIWHKIAQQLPSEPLDLARRDLFEIVHWARALPYLARTREPATISASLQILNLMNHFTSRWL